MKVHLLVQRDVTSGDTLYWIEDAVDEFVMDEWNGGAYPDVIRRKLESDPLNLRVLIVELPDNALELPFRDTVIFGEVASE
jgi:hypothetical protein